MIVVKIFGIIEYYWDICKPKNKKSKEMKRHFIFALCLMLAVWVQAQDLVVGSYNIRNENRGDYKNGDGWKDRYMYLCDQIAFESPDLFGTQECLKKQIDDMLGRLDEYAFIGVGREDGKEGGEYSPVFYKKDRFTLLDSGTFWLAEDPTQPVMGWDAACKRVCTWGHFKDKVTKRTFYFFNTHMDHIGVTARREGARLIVAKMQELMTKKDPVILTGDFNVDQTSEPYRVFTESGFLKDCYESATYKFAPIGTFNDFDIQKFTNSRIDHIFVSKSFKVDRYGVLTDSYWKEVKDAKEEKAGAAPQEISFKKYQRHSPSDHYPIMAKLRF